MDGWMEWIMDAWSWRMSWCSVKNSIPSIKELQCPCPCPCLLERRWRRWWIASAAAAPLLPHGLTGSKPYPTSSPTKPSLHPSIPNSSSLSAFPVTSTGASLPFSAPPQPPSPPGPSPSSSPAPPASASLAPPGALSAPSSNPRLVFSHPESILRLTSGAHRSAESTLGRGSGGVGLECRYQTWSCLRSRISRSCRWYCSSIRSGANLVRLLSSYDYGRFHFGFCFRRSVDCW